MASIGFNLNSFLNGMIAAKIKSIKDEKNKLIKIKISVRKNGIVNK